MSIGFQSSYDELTTTIPILNEGAVLFNQIRTLRHYSRGKQITRRVIGEKHKQLHSLGLK